MSLYTLAKDIEKNIPQQYSGKIKSFSASSSIKGNKIHCIFEIAVNSNLYSSHISFNVITPTNISPNKYRDIIIKNLVDAFNMFTNYITSKPNANISYLEDKYSKQLESLIGVDLMF